MPPKSTAATAPSGAKQYDETVVLALLMHLRTARSSLHPALKTMHTLDPSRTISSYEHSLRAVNKLAAEKAEELGVGKIAASTPRKRKGGADGDGGDGAKKVKGTPKQANSVKQEGVKKQELKGEGAGEDEA